MAISMKWYSAALANAFGSGSAGNAPNIDWLSDTINVALVSNAYTPDQDAHDFWDDVVANELANGNGYTTNGATLANKTLTYDSPTNVWTFDADDVSWAASTFTARYAVIYDRTPATNATRPLIGYVDFGADETTSNSTLTIQWAATGLFTITVS